MAPAVGWFSQRHEGDFAVGGDPDELDQLRRAQPGVWTWLRQVHGARVVTVTEPGEHAGTEADAAVTDVPGAVLAIHTADCVPVLFSSRDGVVGAAHAGWRGLVGGVLEATIDAMGALGATAVTAHVGPHIRARCYEFGSDALDEIAATLGPGVRATTAWGTPALDLLAGVRSVLDGRDDVRAVITERGCTACEPETFFSHRARTETGRMVATIVLGDPATGR